MINRYLLPGLLLAAVIALTACGGDEEATPGADQTPEPETIDVEMTIEDFSYDPGVINAELGDEIFIELANDGEEEHTFTVNEFFVDEALESGQDMDVSFTPDETGEFTFFCRNHPDTMQGTIRVARPGESPDDPTPKSTDDSDGGGFGY